MKKLIYIILLLSLILEYNYAQRIKDIAYFGGSNSEQLIGYGLVVGLSGTGDSYRSTFTVQSVVSMLKRFGITVPETNLRTRNIAAVMVTARINNSLKQGNEFDVNVSSMGDATGLAGGTLLLTPLAGRDGNVYGYSQGPLSVGGYDITTESGSRVAKNFTLSGRIPAGGIIEMPLKQDNQVLTEISIILKTPDYTTANNVAQAIMAAYGEGSAKATGASEIKVNIPAENQQNLSPFLAAVESIEVQRDAVAKVILNERTGTVVSGSMVKILPASISHAGLNINIKSFPLVSQPNSFSQGKTVYFTSQAPKVEEEDGKTVVIEGATNVQEVASALNSLKVSPRDIIAIFQALKEAGALTGELIII